MSGPSDDRGKRRIEFGRSFPFVLECVPNIMLGASRSKFQTTSWSLVLAAAVDPTTDSRRALETLCQIYWSPVYAFIRRNGHSLEQAQDLTQGFFTLLLEKNYLRDADRERGRFRSFLLTSVKHFLANEWDKANALKRGGGRIMLSIDTAETEAWYAPAAVEHTTPEDIFERRWALSLLEQVMARLRADFVAAGRAGEFDRLVVFLNREPDAESYEAVAGQMGVSAGALRMSAFRLRRRYRNLLRAEIAQTVSTPEETDEEIRFLLSTLDA
jgi:DNA-directed RNA polymerase specialized sigma24 family protein